MMNKKNIRLGVWIHRWIDILNIMDYGENEFHKVEKEIIGFGIVEFFVYLDGSSLFRAVSEDVSKIK